MIPYGGTYVVEGTRRISDRLVTVQVITDTLQRLHVTVPYALSSDADIATVIGAAVSAINVPPKPLGS